MKIISEECDVALICITVAKNDLFWMFSIRKIIIYVANELVEGLLRHLKRFFESDCSALVDDSI